MQFRVICYTLKANVLLGVKSVRRGFSKIMLCVRVWEVQLLASESLGLGEHIPNTQKFFWSFSAKNILHFDVSRLILTSLRRPYYCRYWLTFRS